MSLKFLSSILCMVALVFLQIEVSYIITGTCIFVLIIAWLPKLNKHFISFVKLFSLLIICVFLWRKYHSLFVTDCGISLVLVLSFLKLLELETSEDYFNMFLVLILLEASVFIVNPNMAIFVLGLFKIFSFFYYLVKLRKYTFDTISFVRVIILVIPSLFFSIMLYFTFPRFTQGFINFTNTDLFITSSNSNITFSELGPINLSSKKSFTAFGLPNTKTYPPLIYWKSNILWDFRNGNWRAGASPFKSADNNQLPIVYDFHYSIKTENQYIDFIPHFDTPSSLRIKNKRLDYYNDGTFKVSPTGKFQLDILIDSLNSPSYLATRKIETIKGLKLSPSDENPQILNAILKGEKIDGLSFRDRFKRVYSFFSEKQFVYSTTPPPYKTTQDFVLNGSLGYCTHFAAAYAYLLRLVKIPSRVIVGYQGGEINNFDQSVIVRELDSHVWIEYLNENNFWVRFDPTELVAPDRIKTGATLFLEKLNPYLNIASFDFPKSWLRFSSISKIEYLFSYLESSFSNKIFNLDLSDQRALMKNKTGLYFVFTLITFLFFYYFFTQIKVSAKLPWAEKEYFLLKIKLSKLGIVKTQSETASEFLQRAVVLAPEMQLEIKEKTEQYIKHTYDKNFIERN